MLITPRAYRVNKKGAFQIACDTNFHILGGAFIRQEMFMSLTAGVASFKVITPTLKFFHGYRMEYELPRKFQACDVKYNGMQSSTQPFLMLSRNASPNKWLPRVEPHSFPFVTIRESQGARKGTCFSIFDAFISLPLRRF